MIKAISRRGAAVATFILLTLVGGSSEALGQTAQLEPTLKPVAMIQSLLPAATPTAAPVAATAPAAKPSLDQLVEQASTGAPLDEEQQCLATAVYFESMGEPLQGQLAVARVVINRAASGRYPTSWCGVVKQKAQFSFVRNGQFPHIDAACQAWRKAQAIARIAVTNATDVLPTDVLWYHADYVAPKWRNSLVRVEKIGAHIFYRA